MTAKTVAVLAFLFITTIFGSEVGASISSACPAGSLAPSDAVNYAWGLVNGCSNHIDPSLGQTYRDAVSNCMKDILSSSEARIRDMKCPSSSSVTAILVQPIGACGRQNSAKAENVPKNAVSHADRLVNAIPAIVRHVQTRQVAVLRCQGCHLEKRSAVSRRTTGNVVLPTGIRGCCCDYCYQFDSDNRAWCFYNCCGLFGSCCC
jgi:hypothetical protein